VFEGAKHQIHTPSRHPEVVDAPAGLQVLHHFGESVLLAHPAPENHGVTEHHDPGAGILFAELAPAAESG